MRIVSLLPSATEIVCALGLDDQLVAVSHECDHPPGIAGLPRVTRSTVPHGAPSARIDEAVREHLQANQALYTLDRARLEVLRPDLIVTQALCDVCAVAEDEVQALATDLPGRVDVVNLEPMTLEGVLESLQQVGEAAGVAERARTTVTALRARIDAVAGRTAAIPAPARPRVLFLEWLEPPFNAGHWTPTLVELAGGQPRAASPGNPSHTLDWAEIVEAAPQVLFIACCGLSLERTLEDLPALAHRPGWDTLPCVRAGRVYVTDGNSYFSRPGPRLVESLEIMAHALHPEVHPPPRGAAPAWRVPSADPVPAGDAR